MVTLKIDYECDSNFNSFLKECNKVKRIAFNLFKKFEDKTEVSRKIKSSYNINSDLVDATIFHWQVSDAYGIQKSCKERNQNKLIFGSLREWKRFNSGLISKKEFQDIRNHTPVLFVGASNEKLGNRKIKLDLINNQIIFKRTKCDHHFLKLKTSNSRLKLLQKLQDYFEYNSTPITYKLSDKHIYIIFDESVLKEKEHKFLENRIASLDLNPNYIGFTIKNYSTDEVIYKSVFNLTELNSTHNKNKKDYEIIEISKTISKLCQHYQVECVGLEKLTMVSKNHGKGKKLNRLINNSWNRNKFVNNLKKRLNILGIQNQEIVCAYSSTVGCLEHPEETDSIAAALEIGRRCYVFLNRFIKKRKEFSDKEILFPPFNKNQIKERWNSILDGWTCKKSGWKDLHNYLKQQKKLIKLRFLFKDYPFEDKGWSCLRLNSKRSLVDHLWFN